MSGWLWLRSHHALTIRQDHEDLSAEKVGWQGVEKNKLAYKCCRPVMIRYEGCAVCMKVCLINRYGAKAVMEHYLETGEFLGKGTSNLEGYTLHPEQSGQYAVGYFGPGELPVFNAEFFNIPQGTRENAALDDLLKVVATARAAQEHPETDEALLKFRDRIQKIVHGEQVSDSTMF
jgi:hypothetical protein